MRKSHKPMNHSKISRALSAASGYGLVCAAAIGMTASGCDGGDDPVRGERIAVTPAGTQAAVTSNVQTMMDLMWRVERFVDTADTLKNLGNALGGSDDEEPTEDGETGFLLPKDTEAFDDFQADLRDNLKSMVLREDRIESQTNTSIVYRVDPELFCGTDEEQADCRTALTALDARVAVSSVNDGDINMQVLLGAEKAEVALFEAHADTLALTVNAGPLVDAFITVEKALDPGAQGTVAVKARGSVRVALRKLSATTMRATADVTTPILIEATNPDGPVTIAADVGGAAIEVNLLAETGELEVDLRDLAITGAKRLVFNEEACIEADREDCTPPEGTFGLVLGRLAGIVALNNTTEEVSVTGLLLGDFGFTVDGKDVVVVGLGDGNKPIDLTASTTTRESLLELAINGATTLNLELAMGLADDLWPELADTWLADDFLTFEMPAQTTKAQLDNGVLSLTAGSVILTSEARPDLDRTIEVAQCIQHIESEDVEEPEDDHPFALEVIDCGPSAN